MINKIVLSVALLLSITTCLFSQQKRPQEPVAPFPYLAEDITYKNEIDNINLAGTLTLPKEGADFPAVILISGSGPQDRNSEIYGHKSFLVIADYLTRNGIAVLRVDDRGVGKSKGVYNESSLDGFKRDTEYAIKYLKTRKEINCLKIGLIGHSLGGVIAPMIASESKDINYIILLAGSGIRGDKLMLLQKEVLERKMGASEAAISVGQKNIGGAYEIILKSTAKDNSLKMDLNNYFTKIFGTVLPKAQIDQLSQQLSLPWFSDFIKYDPQKSLSKVKCPVLALNGSNDMQVPSKENLKAIETAIKKNGNNDIKTIELSKLNHLFQESETGLPNEYGSIEQTFSPEALKIMGDWILQKTK